MKQNSLSKIFKTLLTASFLAMGACEEWTPLAEGYFSVDGQRWKVHVMYIDGSSVIHFQGNEVNTTVSFWPQNIAPGTYHVAYSGNEPNSISVSVYCGPTCFVDMDNTSTGTMTLELSGGNYVVEFSGTINGRNVEVRYRGRGYRI
jgi:hypothetical protein